MKERLLAADIHGHTPSTWEITLRVIGGLLRVMDQRIQKEVGIPLAWFDILVNLYIAPDRRLRMRDLAQAIVLTRSGITRLVDRIEEAGFVRREPSVEDRRGYYAVLTEKGVEVTERAQPIHGDDIDAHFMHFLSRSEEQALNKIMFRIWEENPLFAGGNNSD